MVKTLFTLFSLAGILLLCSCQKEVAFIGDPAVTDTAGNIDTTGMSLSDNYLPVTTGTFWIYADSGFSNSNDTVTMVGEQDTIINTISYKKVHSHSAILDDDSYYGQKSHSYYLYGEQNGVQVTMLMLNDTTSVGNGWVFDMGLVNGLPGRGTGKIIEKDISFMVKGKIYNNVIHDKYTISYNLLGSFIDFGNYDFYFAKGIGLIKIISSVPATLGGADGINSKQELINYSIK